MKSPIPHRFPGASALATLLWVQQIPGVMAQDRPAAPQPFQGPWSRDVIVSSVSGSGETRQLATFARAGVPT